MIFRNALCLIVILRIRNDSGIRLVFLRIIFRNAPCLSVILRIRNAFGIRLVILRILRRIVSRPQLKLHPKP